MKPFVSKTLQTKLDATTMERIAIQAELKKLAENPTILQTADETEATEPATELHMEPTPKKQRRRKLEIHAPQWTSTATATA